LCPIDFDDNSVLAVKEAAALALRGGGSVRLFHVVQMNPLAAQGAMQGDVGGEMYEAQIEKARQQIEEMTEGILSGVQHRITIEFGEPGDTIISAAARLGADLVVMATHGRTGLKHFFLGSVAERVVRESSVPVLTVRGS
jgi:nucleotide-binding universal stress UspA family protein